MTLFAACISEERCLVTLDLDFANPLRFAPEGSSGIAVLRLAGPASAAALDELAATFAEALRTREITGKLWIVEPGRIREHLPETAT